MKFICFFFFFKIFLQIGNRYLFLLFIENSIKQNMIEKSNKIANTVIVRGIDKELVGQTAAVVRTKRPPEVYRGKGIKYAEEVIRRKEGKAGKK